MPLGPGVRYRYKRGTDVRLAFKGGQVIEAKNTKTGATHTPSEFKADRSGQAAPMSATRSTAKARAGKKATGEARLMKGGPPAEGYNYLGHFKGKKVMKDGHNTSWTMPRGRSIPYGPAPTWRPVRGLKPTPTWQPVSGPQEDRVYW